MSAAAKPNFNPAPVMLDSNPASLALKVNEAMANARAAQAHWARTTVAHRLERVRELRRLITEQALQLAEASASARLLPALVSLTAEVLPLAEACRYLERNAAKLLAPRKLGRRGLPLWLQGVRSEIRRDPLGVILIIGPGNYPLLLPGVQLIQALVAGNAVLLKPGVGGGPAAHALCQLVVQAGFAPNLITLLPETAEAAQAAIAAQPDKILFTGSAATGEKILAQLAPRLLPAVMELSGCDAVVIRPDADLDLTVKALEFGVKLNDGATCMAPKRLFVARSVATELEGRLTRAFNPYRTEVGFCGSGSGERQVGDNSSATGRLQPLRDALDRGAHFIAGQISPDGRILSPVILGGVDPESALLKADLFVPIVAIITVADDEEAIARVNACPFALAASIFSEDESTARALAMRIKAGVITINDLIIPTADARVPFGGRGRSGFGVTRGPEGLLELTAPQVITLSRSNFRPALDPSQPGDEQMFLSYLRFSHGNNFRARSRALIAFIKAVLRRRKSIQENLS